MTKKISPLLITHSENERTTAKVYISEPTPLEEKSFGTIMTVIDIESNEGENEEIINLINEEITQNYYRSPDLEIELAFENTLNLLNRKLQQVTSELGEDWLKNLNAVIAVFKDKEVHFTQIGSINILLTQKETIIKLDDSKHQTPNPLKIFSDISSGQINKNSALMFCTESVLDYLSQEKIKNILQENNSLEASLALKKLLNENDNSTNFGAIIIKMAQLENEKSKIIKDNISENDTSQNEVDTNDSMNKLVFQEETTEELLTPSFWTNVKKNIESWTKTEKSPKNESSNTFLKEDEKTFTQQTSEKNNGQIALEIIKKILIFLKNLFLQILAGLIWLIKKIISLFKGEKKYSSQINSLPRKTTGIINKIVNWFNNLSTPRKIFLVLVIVLIFIFSQSIISQGKKQEAKQEQEQYQHSISEATNKLGEIETKILMGDYSGAKNLLKESKELLNSVPTESKTWEEKNGQEQLNKLTNFEDKVNLVNRLSEPTLIANFSEIDKDLNIKNISLISNNIFAFADDKDEVYRYNIDNSEANITITENEDKKIQAIQKDSAATILALFADQTLSQFNPVLEKFSNIELTYPDGETDVIDIKTFGSRLYSLDAKNNKIFKATKIGDNYGQAENWLSDDETKLDNSVSFSIDGSIYVLKNNGSIIKLFSGTKDNEWELENIQPSLEGSTKIFTDEETINIYILNPSEKRFVVISKEGKLIKQYTSDKWDNLKDMYVDEINNKIYLLNDKQIFTVDL